MHLFVEILFFWVFFFFWYVLTISTYIFKNQIQETQNNNTEMKSLDQTINCRGQKK